MNEIQFDLNAAELEAIVRFLGYGRVSAPVWFLGFEEGLGDMTSQDAMENLKKRGGFREIMDLREAHLPLKERGKTIDVQINPPATQVWRWMAKIVLALQGCRHWRDSKLAKAYVRFHLGRRDGETFLTELSPIPAKHGDDKSWMGLFRSRDSELDKKLSQRKARLQGVINENQPSVIICYGNSRADQFADLLGVRWRAASPRVRTSVDHTRWLLPFFGMGHMSESVVDELISLIAAASARRLSVPRAEL